MGFIHLVEENLNPSRVVGYSRDAFATIAPVGMLCQVSHYCRSQCSQLSGAEGVLVRVSVPAQMS